MPDMLPPGGPDPLLRAALDTLPFGVLLYGSGRQALWINRAFLALSGLPAQDFPPGTTAMEVTRALHARGWYGTGPEADRLAFAAPEIDIARPHQVIRHTTDGRHLDVRYGPLPGGGYVVTAADVTRLFTAEAEAKARGRLLDTVLEESRAGVAVFDAAQRLILSNAAFTRFCGLDAGALAPGIPLRGILETMRAAGELTHLDADAYIAEVLGADRRIVRRVGRRDRHGRWLTFDSDPLPDGGFFVTVSDISELASAREEAEHRGRLLEGVLASTRHGIAVYDARGGLALCNDSYIRMFGLRPQDMPEGLTEEGLLRLLAARGEYAHIDAEAFIAQVLATDRSRPHRRRRTRPDGTVVEIFSDPLADGGFVLTVSDVTELARAEAEASARAALLDSVLAALPQGISIFGPDQRLLLANPAYATVMGEAAARPGEDMDSLITRRLAMGEYGTGEAAHAYAEQARRDNLVVARRRRTRPDGTTVDVRTAALPDRGHISVVTDVTLEVAAQGEIARRTALLDLTMANVRHGMMLFDADERLVLCNAQSGRLIGTAPGFLRPGVSRFEIIDHLMARGAYGTGEAARALAERLRATSPRNHPGIERAGPDGTVIEQQCSPIPDGGYVLSVFDVTWRRTSEAALREAKEAAEAASRAKSSFLATMSHELRTPLNAIIGFSEAIGHEAAQLAPAPQASEDAPPARVREYAAAVNDAGRHLLSLINDILDVARIEAGNVELAEAPVDLAGLLQTCRRLMEPAARAAGVSLSADIPPGLALLRGDERRLRQVLLNLLSNAVKFTPQGGAAQLGARREPDGGVALLVRDTGIGIAQADIPRAFEPFTQLDGAIARRFQGSGLGLFISRALAAAHGGTLDLESTPGQGTSAILHLPAGRVLGPDTPSPPPSRTETTP